MKYILPIFAVISTTLFSCGAFKNMGKDVVDGAIFSLSHPKNQQKLDSTLHLLVGTMAATARDTALSEETKLKLAGLIDAVTLQLDSSLNRTIKSLRKNQLDSILNSVHFFLKNATSDVINGLLNETNTAKIRSMLSSVLQSVSAQLVDTKNTLLDSTTQKQIDAIIESSILQLSKSYNAHLKGNIDSIFLRADQSLKKANDDVSALRKKLIWGLIGAGAIIVALVVIGRIIYLKQLRNRKIIGILTNNIHNLPNQKLYDNITKKIKSEAEAKGLEKDLSKMVNEDLAIQKEPWKEKDKQLLDLIAKEIALSDKGNGPVDINKIKKEAADLKLNDHLESLIKKNNSL